VTRAAVLLALLALPSTAAAQEPPPCAPEKTATVTLRIQERGQEATPVATHEIDVIAEINAADPTHIVITPQDGVEVLGKNSDGSSVGVFAPTTPNLTVTVAWRQSTDESNSEETGRCSASRSLSVPVLPANPARGVKQPNPGPEIGDYTFAVAPALRRPNLSPLEITIRSTSRARYPRAKERLVTWVVPMRTAEQVRYRTGCRTTRTPPSRSCASSGGSPAGRSTATWGS
jgi:hypothetical protein